jgi:hypothetical protein
MHRQKNNADSQVALTPGQDAKQPKPSWEFNAHSRITGPCGDTMEFWLASSTACAGMAAEMALGKSVEQAGKIQPRDILDKLKDFPQAEQHCALLAANTLKAACEDYIQSGKHEAKKDKDEKSL